jgi:basic membrane protein A
VFAASGPGGMGVVIAAAEMSASEGRQLWAVGVDSDWYDDLGRLPGVASIPTEYRSHVLTSALKRFDLAVYDALAAVADGAAPPPIQVGDLESGLIGISYSGGFIDDLRPELEEYARRIVAHEIEVPCIPESRRDQAAELADGAGLTLADWLALGCPVYGPSS